MPITVDPRYVLFGERVPTPDAPQVVKIACSKFAPEITTCQMLRKSEKIRNNFTV